MDTEVTMTTDLEEDLEEVNPISETNTNHVTLRDFIDMLNSLPEETKDLPFPIDFKDPSNDDERELVRQYNEHLANKEYEKAYEFRQANPALESFIFDAHKMNYLLSLLLTVKSAEGIRYDDAITKLGNTNAPVENVQDAIEAIKKLENDLSNKVTNNANAITTNNNSLKKSINDLPKHVYVTSLPKSPASNTYYYLPEK